MKQIAICFPCGNRIFFASGLTSSDESLTLEEIITKSLKGVIDHSFKLSDASAVSQYLMYHLTSKTNAKKSFLSPTQINNKHIQETIVIDCQNETISFMSHSLSIWADDKPDLSFYEFMERFPT